MNDARIVQHIAFKYDYNAYDLELRRNIVLLCGASSTGKTLLARALAGYSGFAFAVQSFDFSSSPTLVQQFLYTDKQSSLVVLDNADVVLNADLRKAVVTDTVHQFILYGRDVSDLYLGENSIAKLAYDESTSTFSLRYFLKAGT